MNNDDLINKLEQLAIEVGVNGKRTFTRGYVSVDEARVLQLISEIKSYVIPILARAKEDIARYNNSKIEVEKILFNAELEASKIIENAKAEMELKVYKSDIVAIAKSKADDIISKAEINANKIIDDAQKYADNIYEKVEKENKEEIIRTKKLLKDLVHTVGLSANELIEGLEVIHKNLTNNE